MFRISIEFLNLFRRGVDIGNINISRRPKGIPAHLSAIVYPLIPVLPVGTSGAVSVHFVDNFLHCVSGTAHVQGNGRIQP